jgi:hypothetical protein
MGRQSVQSGGPASGGGGRREALLGESVVEVYVFFHRFNALAPIAQRTARQFSQRVGL